MNKEKLFSIATWNIMGRSPQEADYSKILKEIRSINADIFCIQEGFASLEKLYEAQSIREYDVVKSENFLRNHGDYDANAIFSIYPIKRSGVLMFPATYSHVLHRRVHMHECIWADIIINKRQIRIYNAHLAIKGVGIRERLDALHFILEHAKKVKHPVMICGDMNTTIPKRGFQRKFVQLLHEEPKSSLYLDEKYYKKDERYVFYDVVKTAGFNELLGIENTTWAWPHTSFEIGNLKLDWFFVKNIKNTSVDLRGYVSSDHRPALLKFVI